MPTLIGKAFKALTVTVTKASRGSLSSYIVNAPAQWGQPLPMTSQGDAYGAITPARMREVAFKTPTAAAATNAILDFASGVKPKIRNVDPSKKVSDNQARHVMSLLRKPNQQETWRRFVRKLMRDLLDFGYAAVEMEPNNLGGVANLHVLDGKTLRVDFDEHGQVLGYAQLNARGQPIVGPDGVHAWSPNEVIWFVLDPSADTLYGTSRIAQLFVCGIIESLMLHFVGTRFTDSNIPFGVMDLGDISNDELEFAITNWNDQAEKTGNHRIMITGSRGGSKWTKFGYDLKELDATNTFTTVRQQIMGILGVTANELGESQDVNKSNGYNLSFVFKKRAIQPLLDEVYDTLSVFLVQARLGYTEVEVGYEEIDSRDDLLQSQIDELQLKSGVVSINAIRNRQGQPSIPGGEEPCIFTGSAWIPVSMIQDFAKQQLMSLYLVNQDMAVQAQMMAQGGTADNKGGQVKPPLIRSVQEPEQMHTPDAKGSSTPRIQLPRVSVGGTNSQRTRGPVQTMRQAGMRKEEMTG